MTETSADLPKTRMEARRWIRHHWAEIIRQADMGAVADMECPALDAIWQDECVAISQRLAGSRA